MIALNLLTAALGVVCLALAFLVWRSAEAHKRTRETLQRERIKSKETLDAVDRLAPEFRKAFPRLDSRFSGVRSYTTGVNWANVRAFGDRQKADAEAAFKGRQLSMEKLTWENARKSVGKGK